MRFLRGAVIAVSDGDTIKIRTKTKTPKEHTVRVAGIDAPETSKPGKCDAQPGGDAARALLSALIFGQQVTIKVTVETDPYGRAVGIIKAGKQDINATLIQLGAAWYMPTYALKMDAKTKARYAALHQAAVDSKRGIFADGLPQTPKEFRAAHGLGFAKPKGLDVPAALLKQMADWDY